VESETTLVVTATSDGLMDAAKKRPAKTKDTRKRRFCQQEKEESAEFWDAERNHHG
jgi:hypothetical protein